jgi:hypothetical protein
MNMLTAKERSYISKCVTKSNLYSPGQRLQDISLLKPIKAKKVRVSKYITWIRG